MTPEMVDEMNLDKSLAFYKDRFTDASDFTFVFVGSFDLPTMKPLVERYLGAPAVDRAGRKRGRTSACTRPTGVVEKRVDKGIEPKSQAAHRRSPARSSTTRSGASAIRAMADVLEIRLRESLREDLGGTYSVSASAGYSKIPAPGVHALDRLRVQPGSHRGAREERVQARSSCSRRRARPTSRSPT